MADSADYLDTESVTRQLDASDVSSSKEELLRVELVLIGGNWTEEEEHGAQSASYGGF